MHARSASQKYLESEFSPWLGSMMRYTKEKCLEKANFLILLKEISFEKFVPTKWDGLNYS